MHWLFYFVFWCTVSVFFEDGSTDWNFTDFPCINHSTLYDLEFQYLSGAKMFVKEHKWISILDSSKFLFLHIFYNIIVVSSTPKCTAITFCKKQSVFSQFNIFIILIFLRALLMYLCLFTSCILSYEITITTTNIRRIRNENSTPWELYNSTGIQHILESSVCMF